MYRFRPQEQPPNNSRSRLIVTISKPRDIVEAIPGFDFCYGDAGRYTVTNRGVKVRR